MCKHLFPLSMYLSMLIYLWSISNFGVLPLPIAFLLKTYHTLFRVKIISVDFVFLLVILHYIPNLHISSITISINYFSIAYIFMKQCSITHSHKFVISLLSIILLFSLALCISFVLKSMGLNTFTQYHDILSDFWILLKGLVTPRP